MKNQIALLFGSFDPIHIGHLMLANYVLAFESMDEVWFVVSPQNPHKEANSLSSEHHRIEMVKLSIKNTEGFRCCDIELELPRPSYTIDTLNALQEKYPEYTFSVLIGSDNWVKFYTWKQWEKILENYTLMIYPRDQYPTQQAMIRGDKNIRSIQAPRIEMSSTLIREALQQGKQIPFFLAPNIISYIDEHKLYRS